MSKKYNGLNSIKIDLADCGICAQCGRRLSDPACIHATPEQIQRTQEIDAQIDADFEARKTYRNRTIAYDTLPDEVRAESERISQWLDDNWETIPEVEF
jgi:hypothetical protein